MRKLLLALAAAAVLSAPLLIGTRAEAMALGTPAGLRTAIDQTNLTEQVRLVCRWTRWGQRCWHTYGVYRPYPYYARPYYRPYRAYRW
jgi:hypothetical protein